MGAEENKERNQVKPIDDTTNERTEKRHCEDKNTRGKDNTTKPVPVSSVPSGVSASTAVPFVHPSPVPSAARVQSSSSSHVEQTEPSSGRQATAQEIVTPQIQQSISLPLGQPQQVYCLNPQTQQGVQNIQLSQHLLQTVNHNSSLNGTNLIGATATIPTTTLLPSNNGLTMTQTNSIPANSLNANIALNNNMTTPTIVNNGAVPIIIPNTSPPPPTQPTSPPLPSPPILTVQDQPHINPVFNGVNPNYPNLKVLHQNPPIFAVDDFLTTPECNFLICVAQDSLSPAPVVGKGAGEVSPSRTSSTCYLAREDLPDYLNKVSWLTGKPVECCELPQVGQYLPSQQYLQHFDAFDLSNEDGRRFASNGGQRVVTVLVYLNDVPDGGETHFPALNLSVKPKKGMAIVFFPATVDGLLDKMALHAAKPAMVSTKYVSQVWIRQGNYDGLPSKRMFSSPEQASLVQKSLSLASAPESLGGIGGVGGGMNHVNPVNADIHNMLGNLQLQQQQLEQHLQMLQLSQTQYPQYNNMHYSPLQYQMSLYNQQQQQHEQEQQRQRRQ